MNGKHDLIEWLQEALKERGGSASIIDVCKTVWKTHEEDLRAAGDVFYTWQYDIRWAATELRKRKVIVAAENSPTGIWELENRLER